MTPTVVRFLPTENAPLFMLLWFVVPLPAVCTRRSYFYAVCQLCRSILQRQQLAERLQKPVLHRGQLEGARVLGKLKKQFTQQLPRAQHGLRHRCVYDKVDPIIDRDLTTTDQRSFLLIVTLYQRLRLVKVQRAGKDRDRQ
uniref:Putative secreted protein n=1 Tax=Anopheles marajoara TaxID=58244 RepID=A0A2M4C6L1_9DIPT